MMQDLVSVSSLIPKLIALLYTEAIIEHRLGNSLYLQHKTTFVSHRLVNWGPNKAR